MTNPNPGEMPNNPEGEKPAGEKAPDAAQLAAELEQARKALKEANREAAERRKKLEAFEQAEAERKQAEMTEAQKAEAKIKALEAEKTDALAKANARILRAEILARAAGKFVDPDDVVLALQSKLSVNDAGDVAGLDEALAALAKAKPHWVKAAAGSKLSAGNPANGTEPGETDAQRKARIYGGGSGLFDASKAFEGGGGVYLSAKHDDGT